MLVLCLLSGSIKICLHGRFQSSNNISSCLIKYFPVLTQTLKVLLCSSLKVSQVYNKIGQYCKTNSLKACCLQHLQIGWKRGYFSSQFDNSVVVLLMQRSLCFYLKIESWKAPFSTSKGTASCANRHNFLHFQCILSLWAHIAASMLTLLQSDLTWVESANLTLLTRERVLKNMQTDTVAL